VACWMRRVLATGCLVMLVGVSVLAEAQDSKDGPGPSAATRGQDGVKPPDRQMQAEAHYELGVMYHERVFTSLDQAIAEYEKSVKMKPDYAEAHYNLALSYHTKAKLGTDDKALYRKAVAEYKLYLKYSPQGELANKAKQNLKVVEAKLRS
jgi:tetratricopeptide (TPR) repeat protein